MVYKYQKGSQGIGGGSQGNADLGATGGEPQPYDLSKLVDPYFITRELALTLRGNQKQLQGMRDMLHSLPAPSTSPEVFTPKPNYNIVDQEYTDAEAKLKNTPILGTSINQHIAQQQAIGEQSVALNHQKNQALAKMRDAELEQFAKDSYQNAESRYEDSEKRRIFDMGVKQQIQDNTDVATAVATDAWKKAGQEVYSLVKMDRYRKNQQALSEMQREYVRGKQAELDTAEKKYNAELEQSFRTQFDDDWNNIEDIETLNSKYGIDFSECETIEEAYESGNYDKAFEKYKAARSQDWITKRNQTLLDYDETWWNNNGQQYWTYILKKGGTIKEPSNQRYLSKKDRIAIDNNKELHEFIKQMNQKQKEIFLKLMSL